MRTSTSLRTGSAERIQHDRLSSLPPRKNVVFWKVATRIEQFGYGGNNGVREPSSSGRGCPDAHDTPRIHRKTKLTSCARWVCVYDPPPIQCSTPPFLRASVTSTVVRGFVAYHYGGFELVCLKHVPSLEPVCPSGFAHPPTNCFGSRPRRQIGPTTNRC
jgi:hypothetical protein